MMKIIFLLNYRQCNFVCIEFTNLDLMRIKSPKGEREQKPNAIPYCQANFTREIFNIITLDNTCRNHSYDAPFPNAFLFSLILLFFFRVHFLQQIYE